PQTYQALGATRKDLSPWYSSFNPHRMTLPGNIPKHHAGQWLSNSAANPLKELRREQITA
ncbi:hypothetical protein, partial [Acidithiobacillus thiooxidans]